MWTSFVAMLSFQDLSQEKRRIRLQFRSLQNLKMVKFTYLNLKKELIETYDSCNIWIIYLAVVIVAVVYLWKDKFIKRKWIPFSCMDERKICANESLMPKDDNARWTHPDAVKIDEVMTKLLPCAQHRCNLRCSLLQLLATLPHVKFYPTLFPRLHSATANVM